MSEITDAEKVAATAYVVNGYEIDLSAPVPGKWLITKRAGGNLWYWGSNGGWIEAMLLDPRNEMHQRNVTHELDDAFRIAKSLPAAPKEEA